MFTKRLTFIIFLCFIVIPVTIVDGAMEGIDQGGIRFTLRLVFLLMAFIVARLVPGPSEA